ncbi:MAG: phosphoglycerate kinase [Holosporales bacterium]|jgi:phosphoglycerate kinase|nr:phosphoglycerate kinase [Holosporales bacterium]
MQIRDFEAFKKWLTSNQNVSYVLVRCDLNIPSDTEDLSRIHAIKDTILELLALNLKVVLISHYKRPNSKEYFKRAFSLKRIAKKISKVVGEKVKFCGGPIQKISRTDFKSKITLLENLRFYEGEGKNDENFAKELAKFADVYINEAFSVSHRAHASVEAITRILPSFAGISFAREVHGLSEVISNIEKPYTVIIGGSKVSSKIKVLESISMQADYLIITGAMATTFQEALGHNMGKSLVERELFKAVLKIYTDSSAKIILPMDFLVSENINEKGCPCSIDDVKKNEGCFDIGPVSVQIFKDIIDKSKTLLWNGAIGAFEFANFSTASKKISKFVAEKTKKKEIVSIIGGGETVASIGSYKDSMTFVSTAGGAFLEYVTGAELPGIKALSESHVAAA